MITAKILKDDWGYFVEFENRKAYLSYPGQHSDFEEGERYQGVIEYQIICAQNINSSRSGNYIDLKSTDKTQLEKILQEQEKESEEKNKEEYKKALANGNANVDLENFHIFLGSLENPILRFVSLPSKKVY